MPSHVVCSSPDTTRQRINAYRVTRLSTPIRRANAIRLPMRITAAYMNAMHYNCDAICVSLLHSCKRSYRESATEADLLNFSARTPGVEVSLLLCEVGFHKRIRMRAETQLIVGERSTFHWETRYTMQRCFVIKRGIHSVPKKAFFSYLTNFQRYTRCNTNF